MESRHWTGDDDRAFGPDPDEERCPHCGVGPLEQCLPDCTCPLCVLAALMIAEALQQ